MRLPNGDLKDRGPSSDFSGPFRRRVWTLRLTSLHPSNEGSGPFVWLLWTSQTKVWLLWTPFFKACDGGPLNRFFQKYGKITIYLKNGGFSGPLFSKHAMEVLWTAFSKNTVKSLYILKMEAARPSKERQRLSDKTITFGPQNREGV